MGRVGTFLRNLVTDPDAEPVLGEPIRMVPVSVLDQADGLAEVARILVQQAVETVDESNQLYAAGLEGIGERQAELEEQLDKLRDERIGALGAISLNNQLRDKLAQ